jgi:hypothetical protein
MGGPHAGAASQGVLMVHTVVRMAQLVAYDVTEARRVTGRSGL